MNFIDAETPLFPLLKPVSDGGKKTKILVIGNEKGGTGKSTLAIHLAIGFLRQGYSVATLDLDVRQATLSRYLENRDNFISRQGLSIPMPSHEKGRDPTAPADISEYINRLAPGHDVLIIDTPGRADETSMTAHALADAIVTPVGESHFDLDLIANLDRNGGRPGKPGPYAEFVWNVRQQRAKDGLPPTSWFLCQTRRKTPETRVGREMTVVLSELSKRFAFRLVPGFSERVIFQELFPDGLTLLDLREAEIGISMTMSHVAARSEIRQLVNALSSLLTVR